MRHSFRTVLALILASAVAVLGAANVACAQDKSSDSINPLNLTEAMVTGFIAVQSDLTPLFDELQKTSKNGNIDPDLQGRLDAVARKHGFKSMAELDDVADNISLIMSDKDDSTGDYTTHAAESLKAIQEQIDEVKADTSIPEKEKQEQLAELERLLATANKVLTPDNIALIEKYAAQIKASLSR